MHEFAHGVPKDDTTAYDFYRKACDAGADVGCYNAGVLLEAGRGVDKDFAAARDLYARVCKAGSTTACEAARRVAVATKD
jgi:TPR repeat protein